MDVQGATWPVTRQSDVAVNPAFLLHETLACGAGGRKRLFLAKHAKKLPDYSALTASNLLDLLDDISGVPSAEH